MKSLVLLTFVVGFYSPFSMAQPGYGTCYGESGCQGIKSNQLVSVGVCQHMLANENYDQGSWLRSKTKACVELAVRKKSENLEAPADNPPVSADGAYTYVSPKAHGTSLGARGDGNEVIRKSWKDGTIHPSNCINCAVAEYYQPSQCCPGTAP